MNASDNTLTTCHPFYSARVCGSSPRHGQDPHRARPTPLRNAKGYVAFDEVERVLILELQALKLHGKVVMAYCRYQTTHSHEKRVNGRSPRTP